MECSDKAGDGRRRGSESSNWKDRVNVYRDEGHCWSNRLGLADVEMPVRHPGEMTCGQKGVYV